MRFVTALALALTAALQGTSPVDDWPAKYRGKAPPPDAVVARVNGVDITAREVEPLLWEWRGNDAIQDFVTYEVVREEADKVKVAVSDPDVETMIDSTRDEYAKQVRPGMTVDGYLAANGITRSRLFERCKVSLLVQKILQRNFAPREMVKVSTIVFRKASADGTAVTEALGRANQAYAALKKGDSWEKVFVDFNKDTRAAGTKGLVGWRMLSQFPPTVADELKTLKSGDVTKPAETDNGFQIFLLNVSGKEAKGKDADEMRNDYMSLDQPQLFGKLLKEAKIERLWPPNN